MKKFGLFLILALSLFGSEFEGEMKNYDEVFVKIKEQRKGLIAVKFLACKILLS